MTADPSRSYKVVIVGDPSVGKSAIFLRQQKGEFSPELSTASMGAHFMEKIVEIEDTNAEVKQMRLQLWDTAGAE